MNEWAGEPSPRFNFRRVVAEWPIVDCGSATPVSVELVIDALGDEV